MKLLIILLLLSLSGCYTAVERFEPPFNETIQGQTVEEVLRRHFSDKAFEAIKDIPIVIGNHRGAALAAGTNFWSRVASLFIGCGVSRKVIISEAGAEKNTIEETIVHEYIHHLHDMTLDGDGTWIDENEFRAAYIQCARDTRFAGIVIMAEKYSNAWITNWFGINDLAEYIAYVGSHCAIARESPGYLSRVFRKMLRRFEGY